ncbi:MAG: translocation/assembly module TamB domain-containing protein [Pseudohongiellaceae bacterium]
MSETNPTPAATASTGWKIARRALQGIGFIVLFLLIVLSVAAVLLSTQGGSRWVIGQALQRVNSDTLEIRHDTIQGSLLGGLTLRDLEVRLADNQVTVGSLELVWQPASLLGGTLIIDRLHASAVSVDWHTAPGDADVPPGPPPGDMLDALLPLPVDLRLTRVGADNMELVLDGTTLPLRSFSVGISLTDRQLDVTDLLMQAPPATLSGGLGLGLADDYNLDASLAWEYREGDGALPPLSGQLDARGDLNTLQIEHRLRAPATVTTEGSITVGLADSLNGVEMPQTLSLDLQHTAESLIPGEIGLSVAALAGWQIDALNMTTRGVLDDLTVNGDMQIRALRPDGNGNPTPFALSARWDSTLQDSTLHLDQLRVETRGNRLDLGGRVDWSGPLAGNAELQLDAPDPDAVYPLPAGLELNALRTQAAVQFTMSESGLSGEVVLEELSAELNGQPLTGGGRIALQDDLLHVDELLIRSGENILQASGRIGETLDASLSIDIPSVAALYPPANGSAAAELTLSGSLEQLSGSTRAQISGLTLDGLSLETLQLDGRIDGERVDADISMEGLSGGGQQFRRITAGIAGTLADHTASLQAEGTPGNLEIDVAGGLQNGRWQGRIEDSVVTSDLGRWQQENPADVVAAAESSRLSRVCWLQETAQLCTRLDLSGGELDGMVELQGYPLGVLNHDGAEQILRNFHDGQLPAGHRAPPDGISIPFTLPQSLALAGTLQATATVSGPLSDLQALQLEAGAEFNELALYLQSSEAPLPVDGEPDSTDEDSATVEQILWEQATASLSLVDGDWRAQSGMVIYQNELAGSGVSMRGNADASVVLSRDGTLEGSMDMSFDDIAWVEAVAPQLRNPAGRLQGTVRVGGTMATPTLGVELSLREAMTEVPALGLLLEDINVRLENPQDERFTLTGQLRSGDGTLRLDSEIRQPLRDSRSLTLTLQGENVELANLPELQASLSPDLTLSGDPDGLELNGEVRVPVLDITVNELPESAVNVSADTIITNSTPGVRNAALAERGMLQNTPIQGEIRVSLGDRVRFRGFGLDTGLTGTLDITQRPNATPLAYGELEVVNGRFETYGQTLQIEQGKLQFLGSYNNPAMDIRAVRQVGNTRVGVQMSGTLLNIRSQLFSTPALPDADVLAMLITGRPLAEAGEQEQPSLVGAVARLGINQGQGLTDQIRSQLGLDTLALDAGRGGDLQDSSLTMGKYLTPRIFVRYAVGLFDTENTLAIDYTLTERLKLEAQSGETQSLDLIYQMEQ